MMSFGFVQLCCGHPLAALLDITLEFGSDTLHREWNLLQTEDTIEARRARDSVERIFRNIEKGFEIAASRH